MTDAAGNITATYDYYPYGGTRIEEYFGEEQGTNRRFTGHELDEETDLTYAGARYYSQDIGRFTRVDPMSFKIAMAGDDELKGLTGMNQQKLLENPQVLNSYAYTQNNPVKYTDPDGEFLWVPFMLAAYVVANTAWDLGNVGLSSYFFAKDRSSENAAYLAGDLGALASPLMFGGFGALKTVKENQQASKISQVNKDVVKFRHVTDSHYSEIMKNGFSKQEAYFLDMSDSTGRMVSGRYYQDRSNGGNDFGWVDVELPTDVFNQLKNNKLIEFKHQTTLDPTNHNNLLEYDEIIFKQGAMDTINQYIKK